MDTDINDTTKSAAHFFDAVSSTYREKYSHQSPFHRYYFNERLEKALKGLDLSEKDVLDIGSGTGNLYDRVVAQWPSVRFHATDVSAGMLEQSSVPGERTFLGNAYDHDLPVRRFDVIFMLGVTTYLSGLELARNLAFMEESLKPGGRVVIAFSNKHGLDTWMRAIFRMPARLLGRKDRVLASGLRLRTYTRREVIALLGPHLVVDEVDMHNHTIFPFGSLLPDLAIPWPDIWTAGGPPHSNAG